MISCRTCDCQEKSIANEEILYSIAKPPFPTDFMIPAPFTIDIPNNTLYNANS